MTQRGKTYSVLIVPAYASVAGYPRLGMSRGDVEAYDAYSALRDVMQDLDTASYAGGVELPSALTVTITELPNVATG